MAQPTNPPTSPPTNPPTYPVTLKVRVVSVPRFSASGTAVLLDLATLDCAPIKLSGLRAD